MSELSFVFHRENCIQCHGCDMACKMWRGTEKDVSWRRVMNIWLGAYPDAALAPLSLSCLHCTEPACLTACPAGAISKRGDGGVVLVDRALCTGCRTCFDACPYDVPQFGADGLMQKCDMCAGNNGAALITGGPPCVRTCPTGALERAAVPAGQKRAAEKELAALYGKIKSPL